MMKKDYLFSLLSIVMVACLCVGMSSCSSDGDDDETVSIPDGLIGTWYKISGDSHYSMNFTFNQNATGTGSVYMNKVINQNHLTFTYTYSSNGNVTCKGTRVMIDEDGENTVNANLVFNYQEGKLILATAPNSNWEGSEFSKN